MQKNSDFKLLRLKSWPLWAGALAGLCLVCAGAVGLAYFWRVIFELGAFMPLWPFAGAVMLVCVLVYALFLLAHLWAKDKLCFKAALCVFICGLLFVFAVAPMQAPDEESHYLRAYAMAHGQFANDYEREYGGDAAWLLDSFGTSSGLGHAASYQDGELAPTRIAAYKEGVASGEKADPASEPIMKMFFHFIPQALAMAVARLFGFGALGLMYAGRIGNLLVYSVICYFTFKNCARYRGVFFALALLPLSLSLAASNSYDAIMLAVCYWLVSYFCKEKVTGRDLVLFALGAAYVGYVKPNNIFLVAVLLLIPKTRWKNRWNPWAVTGLVALAALAVWFLGGKLADAAIAVNYPPAGELPRGGNTEDVLPSQQMLFILGNIPAFLSRMVLSVFEEAAFVFKLGVLGKLDLDLPLISGLSVLSIAAASALGIQQKEDTTKGAALALGLAAALYSAAVLGGMYVLDTAYMSPRITGVQPRYFLPAILLFFMLCSILLGKAVRPRLAAGTTARTQRITLCIVVAVALVAAVVLFQSYFIGQWLPKGEGGFKLVNMFGWQRY